MFFSWMKVFTTLICLASCAEAIAQRTPSFEVPAAWHEDAELRDVFFVDADYGWAVGDLGTIWHTTNGGEIWRRQSAQPACQLSSVHFVNREIGWIAGGFALPHTSRSVGIVLHTTNGGQTWTEVPGLLLPWISRIYFSSDKSGYAAGLSTPFHPTGVWSTKDGGKTWSPIQGVAGHHWSDADFKATAGVLISQSGKLAWLVGNRLTAATTDRGNVASTSNFTTLIDNQIGFAGDGHLNITVDGGSSWHDFGLFPGGSIDEFSFDTMTSAGASCWLAGSPGTRIFYSHDHAQTWSSSFSGSMLPIRRLRFIDQANGWAVGAYGQIARTEDGGQSWRVQRGGAKRAALLGVFADERAIPWESLTRTAAGGAHRVHIVLLAASQDRPLACPVEKRLQEAAQRIGASAEVLTRVKIDPRIAPSAGDVIRSWEAQLPDVLDQLPKRLTQLVRTWRPHVVLTSHMSQPGSDRAGVQQLLGRLLSDACELAASENSFPDQLQSQGLQPWTVARVVAVQSTATNSTPPSDELTVVGTTVADLARRAERLLVTSVAPARPWSIVALNADGDTTMLGTSPFSGLNIPYASVARRRRTIPNDELGTQRKMRQRNQHVKSVLRTKGSLNLAGAQRIEEAERLFTAFDEETAGELLFQLAEDEVANGNFAAADQILRRFIARYNQHGLADQALQWLVTYHTSYERRWRETSALGTESPANNSLVQLASAELSVTDTPVALALTEEGERARITSDAEQRTPTADWKPGLQLAEQLESKRPALYAEPEIVFPVAAMTRAARQTASATAFYRREMALPSNSWWRHRAATELALLDAQGHGFAPYPSPLHKGNGGVAGTSSPAARAQTTTSSYACVRIDERPHLDASFSDACWQQARFMSLDPQVSIGEALTSPTEVALVHDDEFPYIAARCAKSSQFRYLPARRPRPRDADLRELDRIQLSFDINRDYVSWWQFEIDQRGWSRESLLGDASWNPEYFIASAADDSGWSVELAIPLQELAPQQLQSNATWAIGVTRVIPGKAIEVWNPNHLVEVPGDVQGVMQLE